MHFDISQLKFSLKSETCLLLVHITARQHLDWEKGRPSWLRPCYTVKVNKKEKSRRG